MSRKFLWVGIGISVIDFVLVYYVWFIGLKGVAPCRDGECCLDLCFSSVFFVDVPAVGISTYV